MTVVWIIVAWFAASVLGGLLMGRCLRRGHCQDAEDEKHVRVLEGGVQRASGPSIPARGSARWPSTVTSWKS